MGGGRFSITLIDLYTLFSKSIIQHYNFFHYKVTFLPIKHQTEIFTYLKDLGKIFQTTNKEKANDRKIIHEYLNTVLYHFRKYQHHIVVEGCQRITQTKWHPFNAKVP